MQEQTKQGPWSLAPTPKGVQEYLEDLLLSVNLALTSVPFVYDSVD